jgi:hypothetical protein
MNSKSRWTRIRFLFIALFLFAVSPSFAQTTIIAARNATEVVLAADSKGTALEDATKTIEICKIFTCGSLLVGIAGIRQAAINGISINIPEILRQVCGKANRTEEKVLMLEQTILPPLTDLVREIKRTDSKYYENLVRIRAAVSVVLIGFENEIPVLISSEFRVPEDISSPASVSISRSYFLHPLSRGKVDYIFAGHHEGISEFTKKRNKFWLAGLPEAAKFLVTYMIADRPDVVGFPIDIVSITKNGVRWVQRKQQCDVKNEQWQPILDKKKPSPKLKRD